MKTDKPANVLNFTLDHLRKENGSILSQDEKDKIVQINFELWSQYGGRTQLTVDEMLSIDTKHINYE